MRKTYLMALAALAMTAGSASAQTAGKIAFVNSQKIIAEAPGAAAALQWQRPPPPTHGRPPAHQAAHPGHSPPRR